MTYPSMLPSSGYPTDVPLSQPLYGASFSTAVKRFFQKYATFSGRASRSEYWWFMLFNFIVIMALYIVTMMLLFSSIDPVTGEPGMAFILPLILMSIYSLAVIIPGIAITVRRLHDGNFSGWFWLLSFFPFLGQLAVFVLTLLPSNPEGARFDEYPPQQYGSGPYGQTPQGYSPYGQPGA
ncbi:DUF805 domain-containing protein [Arthrobacter pigmenti]